MHQLGFVVLGMRVAHALAGHDVNDHRGVEAAGVAQRVLHRVLVVTVDGPDVLDAQIGEHHLRGDRILDACLDAVHALVAELPDHRQPAHSLAALFQDALVGRLQAEAREVIGESADRGCVAAAVVVDDDDHRAATRGDVVQRLPAHATGQGAVADDRHHMPIAVPGQLEGLGQTVGVGQGGAGVAGLHPVVLALAARRVSGQAVLHPQRVEILCAPGQHLVHVGLMAGVEDDRIVWRIEHAMQRQGEFDDTQIGA